MKTEPGGQPEVPDRLEREAAGVDRLPKSLNPRLRLAALVVALLPVLVSARHSVAGFVVARLATLVSGEKVSVENLVLGPAQSVFWNVHVETASGQPLLAIGRIALRYDVRDLISGHRHRFGLTEAEIDEPSFSVVQHADGSYNVRGIGGSPVSGATAPTSATPWALNMRVRKGAVHLIDEDLTAPDLVEQDIRDLRLDAHIVSDQRSVATGNATFVGRRTAGAPLRRWPLTMRGFADVPRGIAIVRLRAPALPIRGIASFIQQSTSVRVDDGLLNELELHAYALNLGSARSPDFHIGGRGDLRAARIHFSGLQRPIRELHGHVTLVDDGAWSAALGASLANIAVRARGGAYNRNKPTLRLGLTADADLAQIRSIFAFSEHQPVRGAAHVETLLEAPISNLLVRTHMQVAHGAYAKIPLDALSGRIDYHASTVVLDGVGARYNRAGVRVGGRFLLGGPQVDTAIAVAANGAGRTLPYAENIAPEARVDVLALILGTAGYRARGSVGAHGGGIDGAGTFAVDERGVGEFGPFAFERTDGSSLDGALRLERPRGLSAAWLSARAYQVGFTPRAAQLPGLTLPAFPPVRGKLDATLIGGGSPDAFALAGTLRGSGLAVGAFPLGSGSGELGGKLGDVRLDHLTLHGPLGDFRGAVVAQSRSAALEGRYSGSLERLVPLTHQPSATGAVRGPVRAVFDDRDVVVQSTGAAFGHGRLDGVALDSAAATLAVRGGRLHVVAADALIAGRHAVAREALGYIALSAADVPVGALSGTGLPLTRGNVSVYGLADLRSGAPGFDGMVTVADGRARGRYVAGNAHVNLAAGAAQIRATNAAVGSTFGSVRGSIAGLNAGPSAIRYDVRTRISLGDLDVARAQLAVPLRHLAGTFAADLHIYGTATQPFVDGHVSVPEGQYNGLAFRAAAASVAVNHAGIAARDATISVGSTRAVLSASSGRSGVVFALRSEAADLADFNDAFDVGDTLAGRGAVDVRFDSSGRTLATRGSVAMDGIRFRTLPFGDTRAAWQTRGSTITARASLHGPAGSLDIAGSAVPATGQPSKALLAARYSGTANVSGVELGTWLPALGVAAPVLGRFDGRLTVSGAAPRLALGFDATLDAATVAGFAIRNAHLRATSVGSRITVADSQADTGFAQLRASGTLGMRPADPLAFDVHVLTADVAPAARAFIPVARNVDMAGALEADVRFRGSLAKPNIEGGFDLSNARYRNVIVPRTIGALGLHGNAIELRDVDVELTHGQAFVAGSLPLLVQPFSLGPAHAPLSFDVTARSVDLAQFGPLFPVATSLGGTLDGRFGVEGTVDRPRLLGTLAIANGSYRSTLERAPIQHVNARLEFAGTSVALQAFHADIGNGSVTGDGRMTLPLGALSPAAYAFNLTATGAQLDFPAFGHGTVDGSLHLTSTSDRPLLAGTLALRDAVIPVSAVYGAGSTGVGSAGTAGAVVNPTLNVAASVVDNVRLRSSIVDIGVAGAVDVTGTLAAPQLAGAFVATDGTVSSYNHVFRIVNAAVSFNPADGIVPTVDARAVARVSNPDPDPSRNIGGSANITVSVSGPADANNLAVTYSSDPAYSQEQIVGLLLDVPALLGALNFNLNRGEGGTLLRGAPGETNALLPPGVTPEQVSPVSINQEVFSLLNGQLTQRALSRVERVFDKVFGLSDIEFTVDYGGGIGYSLRRQIGKRDFYAFLSQTLSYPGRLNLGFELVPQPYETLNFSYYQQSGITSLITNQTPGSSGIGATRRLTGLQPLGNRDGFSLTLSRRYW